MVDSQPTFTVSPENRRGVTVQRKHWMLLCKERRVDSEWRGQSNYFCLGPIIVQHFLEFSFGSVGLVGDFRN